MRSFSFFLSDTFAVLVRARWPQFRCVSLPLFNDTGKNFKGKLLVVIQKSLLFSWIVLLICKKNKQTNTKTEWLQLGIGEKLASSSNFGLCWKLQFRFLISTNTHSLTVYSHGWAIIKNYKPIKQSWEITKRQKGGEWFGEDTAQWQEEDDDYDAILKLWWLSFLVDAF